MNDLPGAVDHGILAGTVSYGIRRASLRVVRDLEAVLLPHGFTPPLLAALATVAATPGIAPARLAAAMGHGRSRVAPLLDRLEAEGLLERGTGADRRGLTLRATAAGEAALRTLAPLVAAHERRVTAALRPAEAAALPATLDRLVEG